MTFKKKRVFKLKKKEPFAAWNQPDVDSSQVLATLDALVDRIDKMPSDTWAKAGDFFDDVRRKAQAMRQDIANTGEATQRHADTSQKWTQAVGKWFKE